MDISKQVDVVLLLKPDDQLILPLGSPCFSKKISRQSLKAAQVYQRHTSPLTVRERLNPQGHI